MEYVCAQNSTDYPACIRERGRPSDVYPESRDGEQASGKGGHECQRNISHNSDTLFRARDQVGDEGYNHNSDEQLGDLHSSRIGDIRTEYQWDQRAANADPYPPSM